MKKLIIFLMLLVLVVVFSLEARAESLRTSLVPKNGLFIIHLDVQKFTTTRLKDILYLIFIISHFWD